MLSTMIQSSLVTMNLRAIDHGSLLTRDAQTCQKVFQRDRDCCHVCGYQIPGHMEIDHLKGHKPCDASDLATICQFCHNLKHPIWAGARKRIIPVYAPDLTQEDLHRLAWTVLAWRNGGEGVPDEIAAVPEQMMQRKNDISEILGCEDAESLFEAVMGLPDLIGKKAAREALMRIDQVLRFWPAELLPDYEDLPKAARLSVWDIGGFRVVADEAARAIREARKTNFEKIHEAALGTMED